MEQKNNGPCLICVGVILIIIDFTVLLWLSSMWFSFMGLCLICSGISASIRFNRAKSLYGQQKPQQYNQQASPVDQQPSNIIANSPAAIVPDQPKPDPPEEIHSFCPLCGARAAGKFCPECGSKIE